MGRSPATGLHRFTLGQKPTLPPAIVAHAVLDFIDRTGSGGRTVTLEPADPRTWKPLAERSSSTRLNYSPRSSRPWVKPTEVSLAAPAGTWQLAYSGGPGAGSRRPSLTTTTALCRLGVSAGCEGDAGSRRQPAGGSRERAATRETACGACTAWQEWLDADPRRAALKSSGRFARSANLERDLARPEPLDGYLLTARGLDFIERIAMTAAEGSAGGAWSMTGPYGSGKSSLALLLDAAFGGSIAASARRLGRSSMTRPQPAGRSDPAGPPTPRTPTRAWFQPRACDRGARAACAHRGCVPCGSAALRGDPPPPPRTDKVPRRLTS